MELDVVMEDGNQVMRARVAGDLDASQRRELKEGLESHIDRYRPRQVVIECGSLSYIDSTGLGVLVSALNKVREYGGTIRIEELKPYLRKIFRVTGLTEVFDIEEEAE